MRFQAIEQLAGYVERRRTDLGQRYVGILTDGVDWILYDLTSVGELIEVDRLTVRDADDGPRLVAWLSAILSTTEHLAPTPIEIERRVGALSPGHALDRSGLRDSARRATGAPYGMVGPPVVSQSFGPR